MIGAAIDARLQVVGFIVCGWNLLHALGVGVRNMSMRGILAHLLLVRPKEPIDKLLANNVNAHHHALSKWYGVKTCSSLFWGVL